MHLCKQRKGAAELFNEAGERLHADELNDENNNHWHMMMTDSSVNSGHDSEDHSALDETQFRPTAVLSE
jgi:hypothetical protein